MGGQSSSSQTQSSTTAPWTQAQPALQGILGQLQPQIANSGLNPTESGAISGITNAASNPNPYAPAIASNASSLLAGGGATNQANAVDQNYANYYKATNPLASNTNYDPTQNPGTAAALAQIQGDVAQSVNGAFAASGRDGSGYNQQTLARGISQGEAPLLFGQYNQNVQNQQGAAGNLYNAGNTNAGILSGMQQQANANGQIGTGAATDAWNAQIAPYQRQLEAQTAGQQLPAQNLGLLASIGAPIAGLGSQSTGQATGTQQMSGAQQFGTIANGIGNLGKLFSPIKLFGGG